MVTLHYMHTISLGVCILMMVLTIIMLVMRKCVVLVASSLEMLYSTTRPNRPRLTGSSSHEYGCPGDTSEHERPLVPWSSDHLALVLRSPDPLVQRSSDQDTIRLRVPQI